LNVAVKTQDKDPLVGTVISNRYEILSLIGRGGMGVVYKARQINMDRFMALKMLHAHRVSDAEAIQRFFREAKTISQVKHHNVVTLFDFGMSSDRQPYLVMDYLDGGNVHSLLKEQGKLSIERTRIIFKQVAEALASAHALNVIHRDLKPENIMLSTSGTIEDWVTLVDFGLSKLAVSSEDQGTRFLTKVGNVVGSPPYMSPEQCQASHLSDNRSDIYSMAVCIHECLTGRLPFDAKSAVEMLDCHVSQKPITLAEADPDLALCTELMKVLNTALEKDPNKRQQTAEEFGAVFEEACASDALKIRTRKHRVEVSMFKDLISEAEALERASIEQSMENVVAKETRAKENSTSFEQELVGCPYCRAMVSSGINFCVQCQHQLRHSTQHTSRDSHSGTDSNFSRRDKKLAVNLMDPVWQKIFLFAILLLVIIMFSSHLHK
jgi:serine/threonine protein kinase